LTALLTEKERQRELLARLQRSGTCLTSPLAVWKATVAVVPETDGSGNFQGCFAYACAQHVARLFM
jgi:uncharacterized protein with PIN domain